MNAEVDVVILSWNRSEDTLDALRSAIGQKAVDVRVYVVDQGSSPEQLDELRAWADPHPAVELTELGRNVGVPAGRNIGIRQGSAPVVVSLDNDAVFGDLHALARSVERFTDPGLGAVAFRADNYFTGEIDETSWVYPSALRGLDEAALVTRFVGVGHAIRRDAFDRVGGYDDWLFFCEEELDLSWKMIGAGYQILYDPSIVVRHKVSPEARVRWEGTRVYYQTRNSVLIHHRHLRRLPTTFLVAGGWLAKAAYNREGAQAWRGIRDAVRTWRRSEGEADPLGAEARRYLREHDTSLRDPVLARIRNEVLATLPGRSAP